FEVADDTRCGPGGRCDPTAGCAGGPVDGGARDAGGPDAGPVDAGPCAASERACDDGLDEDCDHAVDCADDDCGGRACDDGDPCTHGDVCTGGRCEGTAIVCADDDCVTRRCDGTASCVETPRADGVGCTDEGNPCTDDVCGGGRCTHPSRTGTCPDDGNPCTTDLCSGGACTHPSRPDGTSLGGFDRCCGGAPVDVSSDPDHCGACGLRCSGSYACTVYDGHPTCDCGAANSECHGGSGFLCSTSYGVCACLSDAACPGSADCVARAGGPDYCTY
ncbi:MAG TPA: hypothetical protein RMH99_17705, partial [Sandaracinaceae bacterium LLY-WYZ-13_1]|nr:hypothetical protein [Sandaracinaceae bacterium LLY-WYZ-13_1]